jgi:hypothetical protein
MLPPPDSPVPGTNFRYLRWVAVPLAIVVLVLIVAAQFVPSLRSLSREGGLIETLSVISWGIAIVFSLGAALRWEAFADRLLALWLGSIALLAGLRELDFHHALGPDRLGAYGMRFRISWWLDGNVSLTLKAGWLVVFAVLLALLIYPPWKLRLPMWAMTRRGNAMIGILMLAFFFCAMGGFIDDQLRRATFIPKELRQLTEEASEMLGAMAFAVSAWLRWAFPLAAQVQSVHLTKSEQLV